MLDSLKFIVELLALVGILMIAAGVFVFVVSHKGEYSKDNPEARREAGWLVVGGIALLFVTNWLWWL